MRKWAHAMKFEAELALCDDMCNMMVQVMYPKSSTMYSLRSKRTMSEASAQSWLESLISSHRKFYLEGRTFAEGEGVEPGPQLCLVLAGTSEWAVLLVQHIFKLYKQKKHPDACWERIQDFFLGLRACCMPKEGAEAVGWGDMNEQERVKRIFLVRASHTLLQIATRLWHPTRQSIFQQFLFIARTAGKCCGSICWCEMTKVLCMIRIGAKRQHG